VATNITVKSPNGESAIYEVSLFDVIDIKKGDYVLVSERPELLGLEIIDDSLKINFPDGNSVVVKDIVTFINQNNPTDTHGLMDKLDTSAISFLDEKGNFEEIDLVDKLLTLIEESEKAHKAVSPALIDGSDTNALNTNITSDNRPTIRGITESGATVTITDDDENILGSTIADEDGNYSIRTSELSNGTQNLKITATDKAGNSGTEIQTITVNTSESDIKKLEITNISDANEEYSYINISGKGLESKNSVSIFDEDGIKVATTIIREDRTWSVGISNFAGTPVSNKEFFKAIANDIAGNEIAQIDSNHYWNEKLSSLADELTDEFETADITDEESNTDTIASVENGSMLSDTEIENDVLEDDMTTVFDELDIVESLENRIEEYGSDESISIDEEDIEYEDDLSYIEDDFLNDVQIESLPTTKDLTLTGIEGSVEDEIILEQSNNEDTKTENDDVPLDEQEPEVKVPMDKELSNNATDKSDEIDANEAIAETKEVLEYTKGWTKSTNQMKDGDATFEVWTKDNVIVYIDTSTSVTDI
jgi:hypothetical protein